MHLYRWFGKRLLDLFLTIPSLILFSPAMGVLSLLVRIKLGSSILFRQQRPGLHGKPFTLCKFRTMTNAYDPEGPPLTIGIPAYVLSRLWRIPFVYQIQDMWPETLRASGMLNNDFALKWVGLFADRVYQWSKAICVISPGFRANLISKGVPKEKIHVISNWVDTDIYFPVVSDATKKSKLGLHGKFNVMFAGNIGEGQGLETIVVAAQLLQDCPDVQFVIVGDGIALPHLEEAAEAKNVKNILFLGRYQEKDMSGLYALADVLLIHLKDDPLFQITIPHKVFAYMASGKPILAAVRGDAANIVMEAHAGVSCAPEDPHALAETIRRLLKMTEGALQEMGKRGLDTVRTKYSRENLVSQIEKVLQTAVNDLPAPAHWKH
jgi:colanic acid biosynthesis glycosyl transferase WcaI